jgi:hypothetical protein
MEGFSLGAQIKMFESALLPMLVARNFPEMLERVLGMMEKFPLDVRKRILEARDMFSHETLQDVIDGQ